jgi:polysaccharide pyruvyl transferase WcaK-like protein
VIVGIRGTNTRNKGAQLMLQAICSRLGDRSELAVLPATTDSAVRRRFGLQQTLCHPVAPRVTSSLGNAVPAGIRADYGLISDREIDGVLDASGFHYTDQLPTAFARSEARAGRVWARRGVPKIVMPQAFGPFEKPGTRRWTREALEQASLVFVRDRVSESYIRQLRISTTIMRSPDFTIGIKPPGIDAVSGQPFLALVPNTKLFTHGGLDRRRYVDLLVGFAGAAKANGLTSVVFVHEATDHDVARELAGRIGAPLFSDADPLVLKAALSQAAAAVASRFHAVVGCLSQSVPTLAFGWSHKYRELLDDFGVAERLVTAESDPHAAITDLLSDSAGNTRQKDRIQELNERVELMWERTIDALDVGADR